MINGVRTPRHRKQDKTSAKSDDIDRILASAASKYRNVSAEDLKHLIYPIVTGYEGNNARELEGQIGKAIEQAGYEPVNAAGIDSAGPLAGVFNGALTNVGAQYGIAGNLGRNLLKIRNMGTLDQYFKDYGKQPSGYVPPVIEVPAKPYQPPIVEEPEPYNPPITWGPGPNNPEPEYPPVEGPGGGYMPPIETDPYDGPYPEPVGPEPAYGIYTGHDLTYRQGKKVSQGKRVSLGPGAKRVILPRIEGYGYQNVPRKRLGHVQFAYEGETPVFDAYGDWVDNGRTGMVGQPTWVLAHRIGGKFPVFRRVK